MSDQPYPAATLQQVESSLTGFFQDLGCQLKEYGPERAVVELLLLPRHLNVNFSAPAPVGSRIRAVAVCRSAGHKVFMASCDLLDEKDHLLAFGEGVYKRGKLRSELP